MALKWWEKTVEYKFIALCLKGDKLKLAPLDGNKERAGDAIFLHNNKWVLIEFKKDTQSIDSEKKKFKNFNVAKFDLQDQDSHHFIVYGSEVNGKLELKGHTYFSEIEQKRITEMLANGKSIGTFKTYLNTFLKYKKPIKGSSEGGASGLNAEDYALVAAINADGDIIECQSLSEFASQELNIDLNIDNTNEPSGPTFRGPSL